MNEFPRIGAASVMIAGLSILGWGFWLLSSVRHFSLSKLEPDGRDTLICLGVMAVGAVLAWLGWLAWPSRPRA